MRHLRVEGGVVACGLTTEVSTVAWSGVVVGETSGKLAWEEQREPLSVHHFLQWKRRRIHSTQLPGSNPVVTTPYLVSGNGELSGTIEYELIVFLLRNHPSYGRVNRGICSVVLPQPNSPVLVDTEPEDPHAEKERVLVTTRVTNPCRGRYR